MTGPLLPPDINDVHKYSDVNTSPLAQHHTLGRGPTEAAPGDHTHNIIAVENATKLKGADTRTTNEPPTKFSGEEWSRTISGLEFKNGSAIGLPSSHYGVVSYTPWTDDGGGGIHQVARGTGGREDVYIRYGTRAAGWGAWKKFPSTLQDLGSTYSGRLTVERDSTANNWENAGLEIRDALAPKIAFHQPGVVASSIGQFDNSESVRTYNNAGDGFTNFHSNALYEGFGTRVYSDNFFPDTGWALFPLADPVNGWGNIGGEFSTAAYRRIGKVVYLRGTLRDLSATFKTLIGTLPVGFRTDAKRVFSVQTDTSNGRIDVANNGDVIAVRGSTAYMSLDNIIYPADN